MKSQKLFLSALVLTAFLSNCTVFNTPTFSNTTSSSNTKTPSRQPNIVLILADDQRYEDTAQMPELLSLMEQGATFTKAYITTPLCCPSRCSILTGQYAHNHGVLNNRNPYGYRAFEDDETLATWLKEGGYTTALIGKYLNGYSETRGKIIPPGWDTFEAFVKGPAYYDYTMTDLVDGIKGSLKRFTGETDEYSTDVLVKNARDFLDSTEIQDDKPFFLYFTPYAPHEPATPPERYENMSANLDPSMQPSFNEVDVSDKPEWVQRLRSLNENQKNELVSYGTQTAGALKALDEGIGQIVETLKANGELENTVIIYMSDNGLQWGEHRIVLDKENPYEESVHVPLMIYDGTAPKNQEIDQFALNIDLAPSILEWAGLSVPSSVDGRSLLALLNDPNVDWRSDFLTEAWATQFLPFVSLHQGNWVYTEYENDTPELYNLKEDPYQMDNRAGEEAYASQIELFKERITQLKACVGQKECS